MECEMTTGRIYVGVYGGCVLVYVLVLAGEYCRGVKLSIHSPTPPYTPTRSQGGQKCILRVQGFLWGGL